MYFKVSMRKNPETGVYSGYYRLVESYRNEDGRVCHRTMVNAGYLDDLNADQLVIIQKLITEKAENCNNPLFTYQESDDSLVNKYVDEFYDILVAKKKIDIVSKTNKKQQANKGKDIQNIDVNSIKNKDVREIGSEWMCHQALEQLQFGGFLEKQGWSDHDINLAKTHLISRAVYPASELKTSKWIKENSSVCEITGTDIGKVTKDKLYRISNKLYEVKEALENHLSVRTNELFDIKDKIVLYDLTNTYFEGRKEHSSIAKFGRSKEKRSDAKLVVLALVINVEGFIKYSSILEGNMADSKTLEGMINNLRVKTSTSSKKALVVIDAGIATDDNLKMIASKGYDYLCVSRVHLTKYTIDANAKTVSVYDNKKRKIELCRVKSERNNDYYLKVKSEAKKLKERSMNEQFQARFEEGLRKINESLSKKGGVKRLDKVHERIGRLKQKYPSIQRYYNIEVNALAEEKGTRGKKTQKHPLASSIEWSVKENIEINARSGIYFLRTSLENYDEDVLWSFYNTIREIEASFRVLKTDLDLRPIYHKTDSSTMAHLHLGLLAYWVVNTIRYQLKSKGINHGWKEIVRIMNTQKAVTTTAQNVEDQTISIRRCSEPNEKVKQLYDALKYKYAPFTRKKSVVHKMKIKKSQVATKQESPPI
ncbi:IS1634 family transposase [Saccharicrinis fermentans]|uniref:IS1634 family transposase n=3 Tax=Saccharicrinis fermentans TaxID=982 RepID=UPI0004815B24|nr:IS1634 family transposase [Saccharicrinis fermentans]